MSAPRRSSGKLGALGVLLLALAGGACASAPPRQPISPAALAARAQIERGWQSFSDLRSLAEIRIRRDGRAQRVSGPLLLRGPSSLRFEALSPFGPPILLISSDAEKVTLWEVLKNRAYILPSSPKATRRWLGLPLGADDLVAILSGHIIPLKDARGVELLPADEVGPSLTLTGEDGAQRIWFDPASGQVKQAEWTGRKNAARVVFMGGGSGEPIVGLALATLDGAQEVNVRYQNPKLNTGFDPDLLKLTVPQQVEIQDFR